MAFTDRLGAGCEEKKGAEAGPRFGRSKQNGEDERGAGLVREWEKLKLSYEKLLNFQMEMPSGR